MTQEALNFATKTFTCPFLVRKLGSLGTDDGWHQEVVQADDPRHAMVLAIQAINVAKKWEILGAKLPALIAPDERLALPTIARERDPLDDDLL